MQEKENRKSKRIKVYHLAKYRLLSGPQEPQGYSLANISDIGTGGARLLAKELLSVSDIIEVKINFPSIPKPVIYKAKIIWVKVKPGNLHECGLQFIDGEEEITKKIDEKVGEVHKNFPENIKNSDVLL